MSMTSGEEKTVALSRQANIALAILALAMLISLFLFQRVNFLDSILTLLGQKVTLPPNVYFVFNKTARMVGNDLACMMLILVFFKERKYIAVAWYVFLAELLILLPLYFLIKLSLEGSSELSSPLLSQFHRLIVNPILMILLMTGFLYQRNKKAPL